MFAWSLTYQEKAFLSNITVTYFSAFYLQDGGEKRQA